MMDDLRGRGPPFIGGEEGSPWKMLLPYKENAKPPQVNESRRNLNNRH